MKVSDCLLNLKNCNASCCRVIVFYNYGYMTEQLRDYYIKHGCKVEKINRELTRIIVPSICNQLDTNTNLCKLHGLPEKPVSCQRLDSETMKSGRYYKTEGCNL